ncbi:hypothetical protein K469DRAFT_549042 [Zopfia rhizophila CBS 207.26]|uniref:Uncharacterized protein n=1 Tax=Zopfia rhizophila CBS 207.26 TaxID=1314779 RepID=A0A6A6ER59_9PEZI|nr:hypothetical protein K469DRAFT_549042 [Zopfia rhizophila CBS 207.26]
MRPFQQLILFLLALLPFALAQESYDATVYITSTVYKVNTVTMSGTPTGAAANSTSTISASAGTLLPNVPSGNGTAPTVTAATSAPAFTGAASHLNVNAFIAALAAGVGYMAL